MKASVASPNLRPPRDPNEGAVKSLMKALGLLERIAEEGVAELGLLSVRTGLPKTTVARLVKTLVSSGYVRQAAPRGGYYLTSKFYSLTAALETLPALMDVGAEVAEALTRTVLWPASIATRAGVEMIVRYSSIPSSPYAHARSTIGKRLPIHTSAHGKAWLAAAPELQVQTIRDRLRGGSIEPPTRISLGIIRDQGYATRSFGRDPSTNTIAAPIIADGELVATLGVTFFPKSLDRAGVLTLSAHLTGAAREAGRRLSSNSQQSFRAGPQCGTAATLAFKNLATV